MKFKLLTQSVAVAMTAGLLMAASSAVMAKPVQTVNPFGMADLGASNLVMSSDHDGHDDHGHDKDKKAEGKCGEGKEKGKKTEGKCGAEHQKKNDGKCGGH